MMVVALAAAAGASGAPPKSASSTWTPVLPVDVELSQFDITASALVYSPAHEHFFALVYEEEDIWFDPVIALHADGTVGDSFLIDHAAYEIAISDDGRYLYSAHSTGWIRRYDVATGAKDLEWSLGEDTDGRPWVVSDMQVMVGDADVLVVALRGIYFSDPWVAVFDEGVARPLKIADGLTAYHTINYLIHSDQPDILYGGDVENVFELIITPDGIAIQQEANGLFFSRQLRYAGGLLFGMDGSVIDAETLTLMGTLSGRGVVMPDIAAGRVYFIHQQPEFSHPEMLRVYDLASYRLIAEQEIPFNPNLVIQPWDIYQMAANRLVIFLNDGAIYSIRFAPLGHAIAVPVAASNFCADVFDDFSSPIYGWPEGDDGTTAYGLTGEGEYFIRSRADGHVTVNAPFCVRRAYEVSAEMRWEGQPGAFYGLRYHVFHPALQPLANYFIVSTNKQAWAISGTSGRSTPPDDSGAWNESDAIRPGNQVNQLRLVFNGFAAYAYINGVLVTEVGFSGWPPPTGTGLIMRPSYQLSPDPLVKYEARFDNFTYRLVPIPE